MTQAVVARRLDIEFEPSSVLVAMSDNTNVMHLSVGVAIGALASTIAADVFKCIKNLSFGIRSRIFIVYARIFEVRSLTISKSNCNTSMSWVLHKHGIRSYDQVAMYEVNEEAKTSVEVGYTYLPTRAWSIYFMSMLGWTHTIHATHDLNHITLVGPDRAIEYLCDQCNANATEDKEKYKKLAATALGMDTSINPCDKCGLYLDISVGLLLAVACARWINAWTAWLTGACLVRIAFVLCTSTFQPKTSDTANSSASSAEILRSEHGSSSPASASETTQFAESNAHDEESSPVKDVVQDNISQRCNEMPMLRHISVALYCNTGQHFELSFTRHYTKARNDATESTSADDISWIQVAPNLSIRADMDTWLETVSTDFVYVCAFDPTRDPSVNSFIALLKGEIEITLMLVLPELQGLLKSLEHGLLYGQGEVNSKSSLHHWLLQVTSGQFKHLRLVIPMATDLADEWATLSRVAHIDLRSSSKLRGVI